MTQNATRLSSEMLVSALIRRVQAEGGFATVLQRGDSMAGAVLLECVDRGVRNVILERSSRPDGKDGWHLVSITDAQSKLTGSLVAGTLIPIYGWLNWIPRKQNASPLKFSVQLDILCCTAQLRPPKANA